MVRGKPCSTHTCACASLNIRGTRVPSPPQLFLPQMRLHSIILALLPYSLASFHSQSPLNSPHTDAFSTTLIDKLSEDPDYTTLLRLLQRAKLIPTLNRLNGSTFFAPTNDAIHRDAFLSRHSSLTGDNVNERLRQELFYHLLNYTIDLPEDHEVLVTKTLHFPHDHSGPPSSDPPPSPPWLPIPGGTLGGEPQRLRVASRKGGTYVGVDAFGKGGTRVVKDPVDAGNGLLLGIDSILTVPPSLCASHHSMPRRMCLIRLLSGSGLHSSIHILFSQDTDPSGNQSS